MKTLINCLGSCVLFLVPTLLFSQTNISGRLLDENAQGLPFANILLLEPSDSSLIRGALTDEDGNFEIVSPASETMISFQMIGYTTVYTMLQLDGQKERAMGEIALVPDAEILGEVEVVARRPIFEQKLDRLIINVEKSVTNAGSTALDVLERSPGVVVNRQSNTISMAGKEGVIIMINNKINRAQASGIIQMLQGMPADNLERVELISTPPAKYDAEGDAGLINLVMKKNENYGTSGSYTFTGGYGVGEKANASLNFTHRKENFTLYGNYGFLWDNTGQQFDNFRRVFSDRDKLETDTKSKRDPTQLNHDARIGLDINLGEKTVLGGLLSGYKNTWEMDAVNTSIESVNDEITNISILDNQEINEWHHWMANLNLQHTIAEGQDITFDFDYLYYIDDNPTDYTNYYYDGMNNLLSTDDIRTRKETPFEFYIGKIDYTLPISKEIKLDAGLKGTFSGFTNDIQVDYLVNDAWEPDDELTRKYLLDENIAAAYTNLAWQFTKKTSLQVGLRYEHTTSVLTTTLGETVVDRNYGNLFPSVFYSQELTDNSSYQLSYSRRISRPTFMHLAPFVIFLDPTTFVSGNPGIQPSISDNFRVSYRFKTILFAAQYSYDDQAIAGFQPTIDPENNRQIIRAVNMNWRQNFNFNVSTPITITPWWKLNVNLMANYAQNNTNYEGQEIRLDQFNYMGNLTQNFDLPKGFSLEISGFYMSPMAYALRISRARGALNFGIQKELNNNWGRLSFTGEDLFITTPWGGIADIPQENLYVKSRLMFEGRIFNLTYSRNFGGEKVKKVRNRQTGSEDEQRRVN